MPRGEDVEIAKLADFPFLVALFLVAPRALTFLLFFTRLPSSFENLGAANRLVFARSMASFGRTLSVVELSLQRVSRPWEQWPSNV